jgi:hypothetical protein
VAAVIVASQRRQQVAHMLVGVVGEQVGWVDCVGHRRAGTPTCTWRCRSAVTGEAIAAFRRNLRPVTAQQ